MAKTVYDIDVLMPDNTTHKTCKVVLTDDEYALVKKFAAEAGALQVGCKSITVSASSTTLPLTLSDFNNWLHDKVPMGKRDNMSVLDKAATVHK